MKLSKREKILIAILLIGLVIFVGGQQIILPQYKQYQETKAKLTQAQQEYQHLADLQAQQEQQRILLAQEQQRYEQLNAEFLSIMPNYDADLWLFNGMEQYQLEATILEIDGKKQDTSLSSVSQLMAQANASSTEQAGETSQESSDIKTTTMVIRLEGTRTNFFDFIDFLDHYEHLVQVTKFDAEDKSKKVDGSMIEADVTLLLYYFNATDDTAEPLTP